jgi:hypothetical protein
MKFKVPPHFIHVSTPQATPYRHFRIMKNKSALSAELSEHPFLVHTENSIAAGFRLPIKI